MRDEMNVVRWLHRIDLHGNLILSARIWCIVTHYDRKWLQRHLQFSVV